MLNNQLTILPESIGDLVKLKILDISENQLTILPLEIINLIECNIVYHNNPIEYIHPTVRRFLNRIINFKTIYNDKHLLFELLKTSHISHFAPFLKGKNCFLAARLF